MKEVKTPKKPLAYYYGIVLIVLIVFNLVVTPILMEHHKLQTDNNHNPLWKKAIAAIHDIYLGKCPEKFCRNIRNTTCKALANRTSCSC